MALDDEFTSILSKPSVRSTNQFCRECQSVKINESMHQSNHKRRRWQASQRRTIRWHQKTSVYYKPTSLLFSTIFALWLRMLNTTVGNTVQTRRLVAAHRSRVSIAGTIFKGHSRFGSRKWHGLVEFIWPTYNLYWCRTTQFTVVV